MATLRECSHGDRYDLHFEKNVAYAEEFAYIEKQYREYALSLRKRAIELQLPEDMKDIIFKEAEQVVKRGSDAVSRRDYALMMQFREDYYGEDIESAEM